MRILVLTPTYFPVTGGAEIGIHEICRRLAERHEIALLAPAAADLPRRAFGDPGDEPAANFEVVRFRDRVNLKIPRLQKWSLGAVPPFSWSARSAAAALARARRPDAVLFFYAIPTGLAGLAVQRRTGAPAILSLIGRDLPGPGVPPLWRAYVRSVSRRARRTVFISGYGRRALLGPGAGRGRIIPFGVDTARFAPSSDKARARAALGLPASGFVLLAVQRLDRGKRVDVLVRAMSRIVRDADARLVVGGVGPESPRLAALTGRLGLSDRVLWRGFVPRRDLAAYLAACDAFVFHTTYETFGLAVLEAMSCGRPVVSVRSTAVPELVEDGATGLLAEPGDPDGLAAAVLSLLVDPRRAEAFGAEARRRAAERYDWARIASEYETVLGEAA